MNTAPIEIKKLNTLRALAALIVLITHFSDETQWLGTRLGGRAGQYGVMLFFLLSGFLLAYLYLNKPLNKTTLKQYLLARIGRVIPLYLAVVLLSFGLAQAGLKGLYDINTTVDLTAHLGFLKGDSVLWSIAPEIHFYSAFIGIWALAAWRPSYVPIVAVGTLLLIFFNNFPRPYGNFHGLPYDIHLFRSLPYFLVGMLFGLLYTRLRIPTELKQHVFIFALLLIPLMYPEFSPVTSDAKRRMWLSYEVLLVMSCVFFCVVFLVPDNNRLLANPIGDYLGTISYSLYLLHMPLLQYLHSLDAIRSLAMWQQLLIFFSLSIMLASVSYYTFERPIARWIRGRV